MSLGIDQGVSLGIDQVVSLGIDQVVVSLDIDKVMLNLKTEEFVLDGHPLQSLQQLIQWVGDFVLYLLANLPNQVSNAMLVMYASI